jgi:hypothetical protein
VSSSVLKSAPKVLFKHKGKVTHHITAVGDRNLICRAGSSQTEVRNLDTGMRWKTLDIPGLNCTLEVNGMIYCGSQYKKVFCVSGKTFDVVGMIETEGSVNSLSLGAASNMLLCGETAGLVAILEIGGNSKYPMRKVSEYKVTDKNISKVVRTTRNDFVLGTSNGIVFAQLVKDT